MKCCGGARRTIVGAARFARVAGGLVGGGGAAPGRGGGGVKFVDALVSRQGEQGTESFSEAEGSVNHFSARDRQSCPHGTVIHGRRFCAMGSLRIK